MRVITPIFLMGCSILGLSDSNNQPSLNHDSSNIDQPNYTTMITTTSLIYDPDLKEYVQNIHKFLLADLAIKRQQPNIAIPNLNDLLENSEDPAIAKILTEIGIEYDNYLLALNSIKQWANLDPNNLEPQLLGIIMFLNQNPEDVGEFLTRAIKYQPEDLERQFNGILLQLSGSELNILKELLEKLMIQDPKEPTKYLLLAHIYNQLHQTLEAEIQVKTALTLSPKLTNAIILRAKLIKHNTGSTAKSLYFLAQQISKDPTNHTLIIFYANALFDEHKNQAALNLLIPISNDKSLDPKIIDTANLLIAEIYMDPPTKNLIKAEKYLDPLLHGSITNYKIFYLLGTIAESKGEIIEAIKFYNLVDEGNYHFIGKMKAALLLIKNNEYYQALQIIDSIQPENILEYKQMNLLTVEILLELKELDLAIKTLETSLEVLPEDLDLLYASSVVYNLNQQSAAASLNLQKILKLDPKNHLVMYELACILANFKDKHQQALKYFKAAIQLSPNNFHYLSNMGILLFKMEQYPEAINVLSKAYELSNSINTAIYLGKALWSSKQYQSASNIWKNAWKKEPNNLELNQILKKYNLN